MLGLPFPTVQSSCQRPRSFPRDLPWILAPGPPARLAATQSDICAARGSVLFLVLRRILQGSSLQIAILVFTRLGPFRPPGGPEAVTVEVHASTNDGEPELCEVASSSGYYRPSLPTCEPANPMGQWGLWVRRRASRLPTLMGVPTATPNTGKREGREREETRGAEVSRSVAHPPGSELYQVVTCSSRTSSRIGAARTSGWHRRRRSGWAR